MTTTASQLARQVAGLRKSRERERLTNALNRVGGNEPQ